MLNQQSTGYFFCIPDGYRLVTITLLLCAEITMYTHVMQLKMNQPGKSLMSDPDRCLGHWAVNFGEAFGLEVAVLCT